MSAHIFMIAYNQPMTVILSDLYTILMVHSDLTGRRLLSFLQTFPGDK